MATRGRDQSAGPGPEWRAAQSRLSRGHFWRESDKSREREGKSPRNEEVVLPYDAVAVLVRPLRGPHLRTWP
jgi:hypothetical protein